MRKPIYENKLRRVPKNKRRKPSRTLKLAVRGTLRAAKIGMLDALEG